MKTYSCATTPSAVIRDALPTHYNMNLNKTDMLNLLEVLLYADGMLSGGVSNDLGEWASGMRSGILQTLGIEEV